MTTDYTNAKLTDFLSYQTTNNRIEFDFEGSNLHFLAYKQKIDTSFKQLSLYPPLSNSIQLYQDIIKTLTSKTIHQNSHPQKLIGLSPDKLSLHFKKIEQANDAFTEDIFNFINYIKPQIARSLEFGKETFNFIEQNIELSSVGIEPAYKEEGFLITKKQAQHDVNIYFYSRSRIQLLNDKENYHVLNLEFYDNMNAFDATNIQTKLSQKDLPVPAIYWANYNDIVSSTPFEETLLPITKRLLLKNLPSAA